MANFAHCIEPLIEKEGGYRLVDVEGDRGGRTYAGISERSNPHWYGWELIARNAHIEEMRPAVHSLYKPKYWDAIAADDINSLIAEVMFSSAVLSGPRISVKLAQRCCSASVDGIMGPETLMALQNEIPETFVLRFSLARIARYSAIVLDDPSQIKFLRGWVNRVLREIP